MINQGETKSFTTRSIGSDKDAGGGERGLTNNQYEMASEVSDPLKYVTVLCRLAMKAAFNQLIFLIIQLCHPYHP